MKLNTIILGVVFYGILIGGVIWYASSIRPSLTRTPLERGLISLQGALPRIRISQSVTHTAKEIPSKHDMDAREGETALEVIARTHPIETTGSGSEKNVTAIDSVKNTKDNQWKLYVNEHPATMSASTYILQQKDMIEWRFE